MVMRGVERVDVSDDVLAAERSRLVGLCAALTGQVEVAEDLAQETLYEAHKHWNDLRELDRRSQWLSGIARHVCLRWQRRYWREASHRVLNAPGRHPSSFEQIDAQRDTIDLEIELERSELTALLDRAMALLPPDSRKVLLERFIDGSPHAEIAQRLGMTEGAVKVKLHRGKLALRRLLVTQFEEDARSFGLLPAGSDGWEETSIWCSFCGERRLQGRLTRHSLEGEFALQCPRCFPDDGTIFHNSTAKLLGGITRYRPAFSRIMTWVNAYYRDALDHQITACYACGRPASLCFGWPDDGSQRGPSSHGLHVRCDGCGCVNVQSLQGLVLSLPEAQLFHRENRRIRSLPQREVEAAGIPAVVTSFQSIGGSSQLDVLSARDTYRVLAIHGAPATERTPVSP